ncbi:MAG: GNAT family N-acetyltransferase [Gemmatales bacterium]|nr:GNAT family N-acetyltransferase [Gemmatales bacterium]MDW8386155.1 GNAT family N-acetyltransferase [Gemmatales bacterium]
MSVLTPPTIQTIRPLQADDLAPLVEFFAQIADDPETVRFFHPHPLTADFAQWLCARLDSTRDEYFAMWEQGQIIGYGMLRGWDEGYDVPSFGVCLLPPRRSEGHGQRLLRYALERCRLRGARRVRLTVYRDNDRAVHIYRKFGFVFTPKNERELVGMLDLPG